MSEQNHTREVPQPISPEQALPFAAKVRSLLPPSNTDPAKAYTYSRETYVVGEKSITLSELLERDEGGGVDVVTAVVTEGLLDDISGTTIKRRSTYSIDANTLDARKTAYEYPDDPYNAMRSAGDLQAAGLLAAQFEADQFEQADFDTIMGTLDDCHSK